MKQYSENDWTEEMWIESETQNDPFLQFVREETDLESIDCDGYFKNLELQSDFDNRPLRLERPGPKWPCDLLHEIFGTDVASVITLYQIDIIYDVVEKSDLYWEIVDSWAEYGKDKTGNQYKIEQEYKKDHCSLYFRCIELIKGFKAQKCIHCSKTFISKAALNCYRKIEKEHPLYCVSCAGPKVIFGKYKGLCIRQVFENDRDYCTWMQREDKHNKSILSSSPKYMEILIEWIEKERDKAIKKLALKNK